MASGVALCVAVCVALPAAFLVPCVCRRMCLCLCLDLPHVWAAHGGVGPGALSRAGVLSQHVGHAPSQS